MSSMRLHVAQLKVLFSPVQVFTAVKVSYILTTCRFFDKFEFAILMQVVFSATSSHMLPLQLATLKSTSVSVCFQGIRRLPSPFIFLR